MFKIREIIMDKGVIFDLDGLLIDSEVISYQLYQDLIKPYGYSFSIEDYTQNYSGKAARKNMDDIVTRFQLPISIEEGLNFVALKEKNYFQKGIPLKKGAKELLEYLKNHHYKIVLATSSTKERALMVLRQHHIDMYFDQMVFGTEIKNGKPAPDIFIKACEKIKIKREDGLVLEDSEAGIQAAYLAQIPVICIPDMKKPAQSFQDMTKNIFPSLLDVITYLDLRDNH